MSKYRLTLRPVLADRQTIKSTSVSLSALPEGYVIHVLAQTNGPDIVPLLKHLTSGETHAVRPVAPGQWFLVGDEALSHDQLAALTTNLHPQATMLDQSHGRIRICAKGPMTERVLAKGTGVDLRETAFPIGHCVTTLIGHIAAHITRTDHHVFELIVLRGFAESLWDDLARMSAEFA